MPSRWLMRAIARLGLQAVYLCLALAIFIARLAGESATPGTPIATDGVGNRILQGRLQSSTHTRKGVSRANFLEAFFKCVQGAEIVASQRMVELPAGVIFKDDEPASEQAQQKKQGQQKLTV